MSNEEKHADWTKALSYCADRKEPYGCIGRHAYPPKVEGPCDHKWNGYKVAKTTARRGMYNRNDHQQRAKEFGYTTDEMRSDGEVIKEIRSKAADIRKNAGSKARTVDEEEEWVKKFNNMWRFSLRLLRVDKQAFHVDHTIKNLRKLTPHLVDKYQIDAPENFLTILSGGFGCIFPYYHNHHHMIPNGVVRDFIIYSEQNKDKVTALQRIQILIASNFNINCEDNMIQLPQEEYIGNIVDLPAHCPYGVRHHEGYSKMVRKKCKGIRREIDKSILKTEDHETPEQIGEMMKGICKKLLEKIKKMPAGKQIGR